MKKNSLIKYVCLLTIFPLICQEGEGWLKKSFGWLKNKMDERVESSREPRVSSRFLAVDEIVRTQSPENKLANVFAKLEDLSTRENVQAVHIYVGNPTLYKSPALKSKADSLARNNIRYVIEQHALNNQDIVIKAVTTPRQAKL